MSFQSCWDSLSCLESWEPYIKWSPAIAAFFVIVGVAASHQVTKQIALLKAPRWLTEEQIATISRALQDKPKAIFRVTSLTDNEESGRFGGQLGKVLKDVGWDSKGMTRFYMDEGESPPMGVNVIVDGHDPESVKSAESLVEVFKAAGIQGVHFSSKIPEPMASTWVLIEVGRKPNR